MNITEEDEKLIREAGKKFRANIEANFNGDAKEAIMKNMSFFEKAKFAKMMITAKFNKEASLEEKAKFGAEAAGAALPVMKKTFGEDFLIAAMPDEMKVQRLVDLCEYLGQKDLADLCKKAIAQKPK